MQDPPSPNESLSPAWRCALRAPAAGWAIFALVLWAALWPAVLLEEERLVAYIEDDAFYYFQIARSAARGEGFRFDGLHPTNGFQPLWQLMLVPVFAAVPGEVPPLRAALLLQALLVATACRQLWRLLAERLAPEAAVAAALAPLALPEGWKILTRGMEGALLLLLLLLTWRAWLALAGRREPPLRSWLGLGLLAALAFLARLEAGVVLLVLLVLARRRLLARPGAALALLAPAAGLGGLYLLWNRLAFDLWLPISGKVKLVWAARVPASERLRRLADVYYGDHTLAEWMGGIARYKLGLPIPGGMLWGLTLLAGALAVWRWRAGLGRAIGRAGIAFPLLAAAATFGVAHVSLHHYNGGLWKQTPLLLALALLGALAAHRLGRFGLVPAAVAAILCLLAPPRGLAAMHHWDSWFTGMSLRSARWVREHVPAEDRVGCWHAGAMGYFSQRRVVNLDGLVNDRDFYRRVILDRDMAGYLEEQEIRWIADFACNDDPLPLMLTFLGYDPGSCRFTPALGRMPSATTGEVGCSMVVWRLECG